MTELLKGRRISDEGASKDRLVTKHGRDWRVRTVEMSELPTFAYTRNNEPTAPMGGGYCITVVAIGGDGEVERGANGDPLPLATETLTIDQGALATKGFDPDAKYLEKMNAAVDAAAVRRENMQAMNSFRARIATQIADLVDTPPALDDAATSPDSYDVAMAALARQAAEPVSDAPMSTQAKGLA